MTPADPSPTSGMRPTGVHTPAGTPDGNGMECDCGCGQRFAERPGKRFASPACRVRWHRQAREQHENRVADLIRALYRIVERQKASAGGDLVSGEVAPPAGANTISGQALSLKDPGSAPAQGGGRSASREGIDGTSLPWCVGGEVASSLPAGTPVKSPKATCRPELAEKG